MSPPFNNSKTGKHIFINDMRQKYTRYSEVRNKSNQVRLNAAYKNISKAKIVSFKEIRLHVFTRLVNVLKILFITIETDNIRKCSKNNSPTKLMVV